MFKHPGSGRREEKEPRNLETTGSGLKKGRRKEETTIRKESVCEDGNVFPKSCRACCANGSGKSYTSAWPSGDASALSSLP